MVLDYNHPLNQRPFAVNNGRAAATGPRPAKYHAVSGSLGRAKLFLSPCEGQGGREGGTHALAFVVRDTSAWLWRVVGVLPPSFELETNLETARSGYGRE